MEIVFVVLIYVMIIFFEVNCVFGFFYKGIYIFFNYGVKYRYECLVVFVCFENSIFFNNIGLFFL